MSADRITLDTNILIYAVDKDAGTRHQKAMAIVDDVVEQICVLTLQALSEFFSAVTRKGKMPIRDAQEQIQDWQLLFPIILPKTTTLQLAINAVENHRLSFWDAMLWATAKQAGVTALLSEDFQHGRELEGVHFRNPFL
jgi:predicted nucleic acid-binding protein